MKTPLLIFLTGFLVFTNLSFAATTQPDSLDYVLYNAVLSIKDTTESVALSQIEILLKKGANPNTHPLDFEKILKTPGLLDLLIKNGFDVNNSGKSPNNSPLIFAAIKYTPLDTLKKIVNAGANIFIQDSYGSRTPLTVAIVYEKPDVVKFLLEAGCSVNELDWSKEPPLYKAITTDNDTLIKLLIDHDADIEYLTFFGKTPLMKAVQNKKFIAVKTLVENGANINASDNYNETPLIIAIQEKNLPIIKYLVKHGAETKITYDSKTLPEFAKSKGCPPAIVSYLQKLK